MNAKRLLKLADFLCDMPRQKFDYSVITHEGDKPMLDALKARKESCGTVACAIGWMPAVFPRLVEWKANCWWVGTRVALKSNPTLSNFYAAREIFAISMDDAEYLFHPGVGPLEPEASAKQVAQHIRRFVKRGGRRQVAA